MALTLRLPDPLEHDIDQLASHEGRSKHSTILDLIEAGLAAKHAEAVARTNALLDRFANRSDGARLSAADIVATLDEVRAERDEQLCGG